MFLAMFLVLMRGQRDEASEHARTALALDPLSPATNVGAAWFELFVGNYGGAIRQARTAIEMHPQALQAVHVIGWASVALGDLAAAAAAFEQALAASRDPLSVAYLATAHAAAGRRDSAGQLFDEMKRRRAGEEVPAFGLAMAAAALGERDAAYEWLAACREQRDSRLFWLPVRPFFDALAGDSRFSALLPSTGQG